MLPEENRLRKSYAIGLVKKNGSFLNSKNFKFLKLKQDDSTSPTRFAFIISTKVSKNATQRNKATRMLREGLRRHLHHLTSGYDCVFIGKPEIITAYTEDVIREVNDMLHKAQLIDNEAIIS